MGRVLAMGMLAFAAALALFPAVTTTELAILYAVMLGTSGGLITVVFFAAFGHTFGRTHLGKIQSIVQVITVLASALGPWLLAQCHAELGSYDILFYAAVAVALPLAAAAWLTAASPRSA